MSDLTCEPIYFTNVSIFCLLDHGFSSDYSESMVSRQVVTLASLSEWYTTEQGKRGMCGINI